MVKTYILLKTHFAIVLNEIQVNKIIDWETYVISKKYIYIESIFFFFSFFFF